MTEKGQTMSYVYGTSNAAQVHQDYQRDLERIRNDDNLSDEGKRRAVARAYTTATRALEDIRGRASDQRATDSAAAARQVYGITDLIRPGMDPGTAAVSFRDAQDRLASVTDVTEAEALLSRAERSGDYVLGRAVAAHAVDMGWTHLTSAYGHGHPTWAKALEEYTGTRSNVASRLQEEAYTGRPARPAELGYLSDREAAALADMADA